MRSVYFVILGLTGTLIVGACSTTSPENRKSQSNSASQTNTAAVVNPDNSNAAVANGMVISPKGMDANSVSTASSDQVQQPDMPARLGGKMSKLNSSAGSVDVETLAMNSARPAPDNSTFTSYLTDAGYEIRTFKNHPQLLRVEKRTANDGSQTIKVFLRNGKIVQLPGNTIPLLASAPAEVIAGAAGIQPATPKTAPGSTDAKKATN